MRPPGDTVAKLAKARGVGVSEITACILDRPRHAELIAAVRKAGAGVQLIPDGDIAGVIWTTDPKETGIDVYLGSGGAPEGVLAAAALRCIGGQMQGRLALELHSEKDRSGLLERALKMGISDIKRKYSMHEMASGDVIFSATGVTDGSLLDGVHFRGDFAETETVVLRSKTGTVRRIKTSFRMIGTKAPRHLSKTGAGCGSNPRIGVSASQAQSGAQAISAGPMGAVRKLQPFGDAEAPISASAPPCAGLPGASAWMRLLPIWPWPSASATACPSSSAACWRPAGWASTTSRSRSIPPSRR